MMNLLKALITVVAGFGLIIVLTILGLAIALFGYIGLLLALAVAGIYFVKMLYDSVDENAV